MEGASLSLLPAMLEADLQRVTLETWKLTGDSGFCRSLQPAFGNWRCNKKKTWSRSSVVTASFIRIRAADYRSRVDGWRVDGGWMEGGWMSVNVELM